MAPSARKSKRLWPTLLFVATASEGLYLLMGRWTAAGETPRFLLLFGALFALQVAAVVVARGVGSRSVSVFVFLTAAAFRVTLLQSKGFTPPALTGALTPPVHRAVERWIPNEFDRRLLAVACDLVALALLPGLLKDAGAPTVMAIAYGWSPLVVKEGAGTGHLESVALLFCAIALSAHRRNRAVAAISIGVGLTSDPLLLTCVPLFTRAFKAAILVSLTLASIGWGLLYATGVDAVALLRSPLENPFGGSLLPAGTALAFVFLTRNPIYPAAALLALWMLFVLFRTARPGWKPAHLPLEMLLAIGSFLMVSPRVFPWSFTRLAYFAAFSRNLGWLAFTGTAPLAYLALTQGRESFWIAFPQYFPAYAALIFSWLGGRKPTSR